MSDTLETLRGKIGGAEDLETVVRSLKALAASSIGQYEKSVLAVGEYFHTVELALSVCLRQSGLEGRGKEEQAKPNRINAVVFGSDQGLVGQFNDVLTALVVQTLAPLPGQKKVWAVGERVHGRLTETSLVPSGLFAVPTSVGAITPLVSQILMETESQRGNEEDAPLYVFHNSPLSGTLYTPRSLRILPLDAAWQRRVKALPWPDASLPEVIEDGESTLRALIDGYLFVSLFRACAESLASENASRLAAMQRAEKNIDSLLGSLHQTFNRQRQSAIDEEMFDVISGFEAQSQGKDR
jgi:F-type H+-transporting ATPase subunit gamma